MSQKIILNKLGSIAAVIYLTISLTQAAMAASLQEYEKALDLINKVADQICTDIPLEGHGENLELSGKAKAELNGVISKLVDIGIEGAAKYQKLEYQGLLQKDLVSALENSTNCKLVIWKDLQDRMLPKITPAETLSDIIQNLRSADVSTRIDAAIKLEAMGKAATPAFPALVGSLNDANLMFLEKVSEALMAIDSVAANPHLLQLSERLYQQRGGGVIDGSKPEDSLLGMLEMWVY
jgi:hypothetical protein